MCVSVSCECIESEAELCMCVCECMCTSECVRVFRVRVWVCMGVSVCELVCEGEKCVCDDPVLSGMLFPPATARAASGAGAA